MSKLNDISLKGFLEFAQEANTRSTLSSRDGLKPVHRRILYTLHEDKLFSNKEHLVSAKVVGNVLGNYHPHGDASVYDAAVRLSQDFKLRYPLVDIYGNNGSIFDDPAAASRYTKMRLTPLGELMLTEIEKDSVEMVENFSGDRMEPVVLPSMVPNVLLNGGMGIGVGTSSSLVPHNLSEVVDGILAYIDNKRITIEELMTHIQGPDFPVGGVIVDAFSLPEIYETGRGTVKVRAKYSFETVAGRPHIVVTEIPYLASVENKIIKPIQALVAEEDYDQIFDVQNNSGKDGLEIRIILEKNANPYAVLQTLFQKTGLESTVKINQTILREDGSFVTLGLRGLIIEYLKHQHDVIIRRSTFELNKSKDRLHIVRGLLIAVQNIDAVVKIIKESKDTATARKSLIAEFKLSEEQAKAILDLRLARLTSLEIGKLQTEEKNLISYIAQLKKIIANENEREKIIIQNLTMLKTKFGDSRRTLITENTISEKGERVYLVLLDGQISSLSKEEVSVMTRGRRGTKVVKGNISAAIEANIKDSIYVATTDGKIFSVTVGDILKGIVEVPNILHFLNSDEKDYIVVVTEKGIIKKTEFNKIRRSLQMTKVKDDDRIVSMHFANDSDYIMVLGTDGKIANIKVSEIAAIGRMTFGSRGVAMEVQSATVASYDDLIFSITTDNQAKLTKHPDYIVNPRGTVGSVINDNVNFIMNVGTSSFITIFGKDGRALSLNLSTLSVKGRDAVGAKIYTGEIQTIICL